MFWVITDGKSRFAYGDTTSDKEKTLFKFSEVVKFLLEMNHPENLEIWFNDGTKENLQAYARANNIL